ncbi:unnamed protein product [Protopolystoma xenopodis]|uniref:Uncharacterized protein n=1 Tax=Protopolystoma xenopodis TaxID=117903 RepID=A0A3S5FHB8_9PLAT|nr:unnamed protein product [Protopolystoma xenopodis]
MPGLPQKPDSRVCCSLERIERRTKFSSSSTPNLGSCPLDYDFEAHRPFGLLSAVGRSQTFTCTHCSWCSVFLALIGRLASHMYLLLRGRLPFGSTHFHSESHVRQPRRVSSTNLLVPLLTHICLFMRLHHPLEPPIFWGHVFCGKSPNDLLICSSVPAFPGS